MIEIVLLGHRKRAGKDLLASMLCERDGFVRVAYADKLKDVVKDLFRFTDQQINGDTKEVRDSRYNLTPRHILQQVGTEHLRSLYPNIWTDYVLKSRIPELISQGHDRFVIPDMRFSNEHTEAIKAFNTVDSVSAVKINRPSMQLTGEEHPSETALNDYKNWDFVIANSNTPEDLYIKFWSYYKPVLHKASANV